MGKRKFSGKKLVYWLFLALLSFSLSGMPSLAQDELNQFPFTNRQQQQQPELETPVPPAPQAPGLNDPQEFEEFVDNFFNEEMSKSHIPGGVVSVVKDGKLFFAKGYGYANLESTLR